MAGFVVGDPVDAARVRASVRARLFGGDAAPVRLGRLELGERIGVGAMGVVYEAEDPELGRRVAVKVLRPGLAAERLHDEARALGRLRHPNVVAVHDVGVQDGQVYLVMERVDGDSLRQHLIPPRPWRAVVELYVAVARGVAAAHAVGLIHRDVKPDNVLVDRDGTVKVADFGLSVADGAEAAPAGTPGYLAPEVRAGGEATSAADQYALGAALHEALPARRPDWLRRAVTRMMAPEPGDRFASVAAAAAALSRGLARRRRAWLAAAAVLLLGCGAAATVVVTRVAATEAAPCPGRAAALAAAWSPARGAAVLDALGGDDAAADAVAHLDRYAAGWLAMDRGSCLDTRQGRQSARALDLRARCLERLRGELDALAGRLEVTGADQRARALAGASTLPPLATCAELERLEAATPLPDAPDQRAAIAALQAALAGAWADFRVGRYQEATAGVEPLLPQARALGWRPLEADVLVLLGQAYRHNATDKVEDTLFAAVTAAGAGGHLEALATAQTLLAQLLARDPARLAEAQRWLDQARATTERAGDAPTLRANVLDRQGRLQSRRDEPAAARASFEAAVAAARAATPVDDTLVAMTVHNLGIVLDEQGEVAASRAAFEEALGLRERALGPSHPVVAETLGALAEELQRQGEHDRAVALFARAAAICAATFGVTSRQELGYLTDQAVALREAGRPAEGVAILADAAARMEAKAPDDRRVPVMLGNLGRMQLDAGELEAARVTLTRALTLYERFPEAGAGPALARFSLARVHAAAGDAARGRAEARAARALAVTLGDGALIAKIDAFLAGG